MVTVQLKYKIRWRHIGANFYGVSYNESGKLMPGVLILNEVGYDVAMLLEQPTTKEDIVAQLMPIYDAEESALRAAVEKTIEDLSNFIG